MKNALLLEKHLMVAFPKTLETSPANCSPHLTPKGADYSIYFHHRVKDAGSRRVAQVNQLLAKSNLPPLEFNKEIGYHAVKTSAKPESAFSMYKKWYEYLVERKVVSHAGLYEPRIAEAKDALKQLKKSTTDLFAAIRELRISSEKRGALFDAINNAKELYGSGVQLITHIENIDASNAVKLQLTKKVDRWMRDRDTAGYRISLVANELLSHSNRHTAEWAK